MPNQVTPAGISRGGERQADWQAIPLINGYNTRHPAYLRQRHQENLAVRGVGAVGAPQLRKVLQAVARRLPAARQEVQVLVFVCLQIPQVVLGMSGAERSGRGYGLGQGHAPDPPPTSPLPCPLQATSKLCADWPLQAQGQPTFPSPPPHRRGQRAAGAAPCHGKPHRGGDKGEADDLRQAAPGRPAWETSKGCQISNWSVRAMCASVMQTTLARSCQGGL